LDQLDESSKGRRLSDAGAVGLLLLILAGIYLPYIWSRGPSTNSFLQGDCLYYRFAVVSLLEDGDLDLANNIRGNPKYRHMPLLNGQLALSVDNRLVPKHPVLMPILSAPFYFLLGSQGLLAFNALLAVGVILLIYLLNRRFTGPLISLISALLYAVGTLFLNYSYNYSPDLLSTILFLGGAYLALRRSYYPSALLLGLSIFAKLSNVVLVALLAAYCVYRIFKEGRGEQGRAWRRAILFSGALLLSLCPQAYVNQTLYGSPLTTGYQRTVLPGPAPGKIRVVSHVDYFNQPLIKGSVQLLLHEKGLLPTNPVLLLALLGILLITRQKDPEAQALLAALCLVQFFFFARYDEWHASHYSNRFLMTLVALSSVFCGNVLGAVRDRLVRARG